MRGLSRPAPHDRARLQRPQASGICIDAFQANRSPDNAYVTAPLHAIFTKSKRGFYHDGRFPTLNAVVEHYDCCFGLGLEAHEKSDLVQFLKSL